MDWDRKGQSKMEQDQDVSGSDRNGVGRSRKRMEMDQEDKAGTKRDTARRSRTRSEQDRAGLGWSGKKRDQDRARPGKR